MLEEARSRKVLAILRGVPAQRAAQLVETLRQAGVSFFEVSLSDAEGLSGIRQIHAAFGSDVLLGAGTVLSPALAEQAAEAGARFVLTPHFIPEVNAYAALHHLGLISGGMTPTELLSAHAQGSQVVKLFPAGPLGAGYLKQLRGPYPELPIMAVGGIEAHNAAAFVQAGAAGLGVGSYLTQTDWVNPDWAHVRRRAAELLSVWETPHMGQPER